MYFQQDFLDFFKELHENNHKQWFDENRKRYETFVKKPFKLFVEAMILEVQQFEPDLITSSKESIFRINRDIRFSKDKTPYKTHVSAAIAQGGKKSDLPGYYLQLGAEEVLIGGGAYQIEKEHLYKIRQEIAYEPEAFQKIITNKTFKNSFGEIKGAANKILPAEFKEDAQKQPLIANKQFYFMTTLPSKVIVHDDLPPILSAYFRAAKPLNDFLRRAVLG